MSLLRVIVSAVLFASVYTQTAPNSAALALNQFAINFLVEVCSQIKDNSNVALSPYTVWNVMAIINEGARSNTERELQKTLGIPPNGVDREQFRQFQKALSRSITKNYNGISLEVLNVIFTRLERKLNQNYQQLIRNIYNVDVIPLDFDKANNATRFINKKLSDATRGRINSIVQERDLADAQMFVTSALFFKGLWDLKFNMSDTQEKEFYNEQKEAIGKVQMMYNEGPFLYSGLILDETTSVVELPYQDQRMSMIILLPKARIHLQHVLRTLAKRSFTEILDNLQQSRDYYGEDNVKVYLPKFKIHSDLNLNYVLYQMGMKDIFMSDVTDLSGISSDEMFLSRVIHKAEIQVDEDGTVASSITRADIQNKIPPPIFEANKPFAFFIYDKETKSIVFAGKYSSPK